MNSGTTLWSEVKVTQLCPTLWATWTIQSMEFSRPEYWSGKPSPSPGDRTQGSNPGLLHCRWILYLLSHKRSPRKVEWVVYPFSSRSSKPRNSTRVSWVAGRFFTNWAIREALKWKLLSRVWLFATPCNSLWNSPGQNTAVSSCSLLQGIFPTQGLNPGLPHCRWILYQLNHQRTTLTTLNSYLCNS